MEAEISLAAIEALIFASEEPVSAAQLRKSVSLTPSQIAGAVEQINADLEKSGRPYEIVETAGGYRFRTRPQFGELIAAAQPERKVRLSRAALDCLAVIAYRQPISRPEVEDLRSVDCGAVLRSLLERGLVRIVGRRDAPGRPALYGTSASFLETFGLRSLRDLPDLRELLTPPPSEGRPVDEALAESDAAAASEAEPSGDAAAVTEQEQEQEAEQDSEPEAGPEAEPERDLEAILSDLAAAVADADDAIVQEPAAALEPVTREAAPEAGVAPEPEENRDDAAGGERATPESVG
jgi:segregation and condensation protein B